MPLKYKIQNIIFVQTQKIMYMLNKRREILLMCVGLQKTYALYLCVCVCAVSVKNLDK